MGTTKMEIPKIERRTVEGFLETMETRAAEIFPGWQPQEGEAGYALMRIYAHMAEEVGKRLNKVPRKHFAAFLDMLGVSLLPANAAKVPVSFHPTAGADPGVLVPKGTVIAADEQEVLFETQADLWAVPARLVKKIQVDDTLYLGFDKPPPKGPVTLYFSLTGETVRDPEFSYTEAKRPQWKPLPVTDHTRNLSQSGGVQFYPPGDWTATAEIHDQYRDEALYWLNVSGCTGAAVYLNTVTAAQVRQVENEVVGSSNGEANQQFHLRNTPVINQEIYINTTLWQPVEDFFDSSASSPHYTLDPVSGTLCFGDGIQGMIPPAGRDNIIASYQSGGGAKGNVNAFEITALKSSIPYMDKVFNPEPAMGGGDTEQLEDLLKRGPYLIKHRNRAVTLEDFQRMALAVSGSIARARALLRRGVLVLIIIPRQTVPSPMPSPLLLKEVKERLSAHCLNTLSPSAIQVRAPQYLEVSVTVDIAPVSRHDAPALERRIIDGLTRYLHPLTGGPDQRGWPFGRDLHVSDIYRLLETMPGVDHTAHLKLNGAEQDVPVNDFQTVCSGQHRITII